MLVSAALFAALAAPVAAEDFQWHGAIPAGKAIEIKNVNGAIAASAAPGGESLVTAVKRSRHSDPESVKIVTQENAAGVTICAVYVSADGEAPSDCGEGRRHTNVRDNDVQVEFTVQVSAGVALKARTVNGDVRATGLASDTDVKTVNGSINVTTTGEARAETVNGSIRADFGRLEGTAAVRFQTVNGSIVLGLPADASAEVSGETVNGEIESDFPLTVTGRIGKHVRGTIGSGGRRLDLETVNGSIKLTRK